MNKKLPPRASLTLDLTEAMMPMIEAYIRMTVEETLAQIREKEPPKETAELLTLNEAADLLKVSRPTLDRLRKDGIIKTTYVGTTVRISSKEITKFITEQ